MGESFQPGEREVAAATGDRHIPFDFVSRSPFLPFPLSPLRLLLLLVLALSCTALTASAQDSGTVGGVVVSS